MKIVTVIGARPQFVKAAAVSREISNYPEIKEVIVHTGQHFDSNMSDVFFKEMDIPKPDYNLEINNLTHGAMTGRMLERIEEILLDEKPDLMLVYGDTNSTLAGALAAKKMHIKVAHVEAGLRSLNMNMPEEINRILTDRISDLLFCPTELSVKNLENEGFNHFNCKIIKAGDVMQDAAIFYSKKSDLTSSIISRLNIEPQNYILTTIHRQENTDDIEKFKTIISSLNQLHNTKIKVIFPIHPRTKKIIETNNIKVDFTTISPVGYFDMIQLIKQSKLLITDSGGLQKEAFFFKKQCITIREETEWVELIEGGYNVLLPTSKLDLLADVYNQSISKNNDFNKNLYGDGNASKNIVKQLMKQN